MGKDKDIKISHENILWWLFRIFAEDSEVPPSTKEGVENGILIEQEEEGRK